MNFVDPSGHVWETVLDVASIGWSVTQLAMAPSWTNLGFLIWDIGAAFVPFVPGSYSVKVVNSASKVSKISDLKTTKNLTVGTYISLNKMFRLQKKGKIEIHHIIEKRFEPLFDISQRNFASIAIDKSLHKKITKRFSQICPRGTDYSKLSKVDMKQIVKYVYKDMPKLKEIAYEEINKHFH